MFTPLTDTWEDLEPTWQRLDSFWARGIMYEFNVTFAGLTFQDFALIPLRRQ